MAAVARRKPISIIGLGCIGGSVARALVAQGVEVRGWSTSAADREQAAAAHVRIVGSETDGGGSACAGASIVLLAVPVGDVAGAARAVSAFLGRDGVLLHAGGLQRPSALGADDGLRARPVGTHPLAGSHDSGFGASRPDLFVGCTVSVEARADARTRKRAEWLWHTVGADRIDYRDAEAHDALMAWVSHLPQLVSTALAATLAEHGIGPRSVGTGARDVTRLAASALGSWPALLGGAPRDLHEGLAQMERTLAVLRAALERGDVAGLTRIWEDARAWRRESGNGGAREHRASAATVARPAIKRAPT